MILLSIANILFAFLYQQNFRLTNFAFVLNDRYRIVLSLLEADLKLIYKLVCKVLSILQQKCGSSRIYIESPSKKWICASREHTLRVIIIPKYVIKENTRETHVIQNSNDGIYDVKILHISTRMIKFKKYSLLWTLVNFLFLIYIKKKDMIIYTCIYSDMFIVIDNSRKKWLQNLVKIFVFVWNVYV